MSTHAKYCLWAGCRRNDLAGSPATADEFIGSVVACVDPGGIERGGLRFVPIDLHEETIGIGVMVVGLNWTIEIGAENEYDLGIADRTNDVLARVRSILRDLGITAEPKLYHHIEIAP